MTTPARAPLACRDPLVPEASMTRSENPTGWWPALRATLTLILVFGGLYPLLMVLVGGALFPWQAGGSLLWLDGRPVGAALVGQPFAAPVWFHGRPSAVDTDPMATAGSNLATTNPALRVRAAETSAALAAAHGVAPTTLPVDLIAASGSGVDPHISEAAARLQVARVAAARALPVAVVDALVSAAIEPPLFGVLGEPRVNVLRLNLALAGLPSAGAEAE